MKIEQLSEDSLPYEVVVRYKEFENNYATGAQRASRHGSVYSSKQVLTVDLPLVMTATKARQTAEIILNSLWKARKEFRDIRLPLSYAAIVPTDVIDIPQNGKTYNVRVDSLTISDVLEITGIQNEQVTYTSTITGETNTQSYKGSGYGGPSEVYFLNLPSLRNQDSDTGFYVAAHGYYSSWPGCTVFAESSSGAYTPLVSIVGGAKVGVATNVVGNGVSTTIDYKNTITIRMKNGVPVSSTKAAVLADQTVNAVAFGADGRWELLQYITATDNGNNTYTLSGLIRGLQGTETAIGQHALSDELIWLDSNVERIAEASTETKSYKAVTINGYFSSAQNKLFTNTERALKPLSPVHLSGSYQGLNQWAVSWVRRNRLWGDWRDYSEIPLSEESESYTVKVLDTDGMTELSSTTVATSSATITASSASMYVKIAQNSAYYGAGEYTTKQLSEIGDIQIDTVLLCNFNGADTSTTITDSSPFARTLTANGNAQLDTAQFKYGTASLLLDGSGDYVSMASSTDLQLDDNFTIECWIRANTFASSFPTIIGSNTASFGGNAVLLLAFGASHPSYAQKVGFSTVANNPLLISSSTLSTGTWYHIALARDGSTVRLFIDGNLEDSATDSSTYYFNDNGTRIGANGWDASSFFNGWIDDLRIIAGKALYTANFTPPTSELT